MSSATLNNRPDGLAARTLDAEKERAHQIRRVLWRAMLLNFIVAALKAGAGLLTGSLSMTADGFHSSLDASSNLIGIVSIAISARPPDKSHPYGHRRFETIATLSIAGLLFLAAWEILKAALERLFGASVTSEVTVASFAVMIVTMVINVVVAAYETARGKRLHSPVLLADASQTRVDFFVSLSVIVGLAATALGFHWVDTLVALVIVGLIGFTGFRIVWQATQTLTDAAAVDERDIERIVDNVPGVDDVLRIRSRGPIDDIYVDVDVRVPPPTTTDHAAAIADEIEKRIKAEVPGVSEVQVHFAPHYNQPQDPALVVRAAADAMGLSVHEITQVITGDGLDLEMHVEVKPTLTLGAAHQQANELEKRLRAALPTIHEVITHIEPAYEETGAVVMQTSRATAQRDRALQIAQNLYPTAHWHRATIRPVLGGYAMSLHCWLPGNVSVQEAHSIAEHVETQIRAAMPELQRVTIHTEPPEQDESAVPEASTTL